MWWILAKLNVNGYQPTSKDIFLLDTNILINLFYPIMSSGYMSDYEKLYSRILSKKSKLLLPAIQVSEFINRCIRFQFGLYKTNNTCAEDFDFKKDYRETEDYKKAMEGILDIVKNDILTVFTVIDDNFSKMNQDSIYVYGFSYDFNDALLVQIAKANEAIVVTHDADFGNYREKIDYVTSNKALLMFS